MCETPRFTHLSARNGEICVEGAVLHIYRPKMEKYVWKGPFYTFMGASAARELGKHPIVRIFYCYSKINENHFNSLKYSNKNSGKAFRIATESFTARYLFSCAKNIFC